MSLLGHISLQPHVHGHDLGIVVVVGAIALVSFAVVKFSK